MAVWGLKKGPRQACARHRAPGMVTRDLTCRKGGCPATALWGTLEPDPVTGRARVRKWCRRHHGEGDVDLEKYRCSGQRLVIDQGLLADLRLQDGASSGQVRVSLMMLLVIICVTVIANALVGDDDDDDDDDNS